MKSGKQRRSEIMAARRARAGRASARAAVQSVRPVAPAGSVLVDETKLKGSSWGLPAFTWRGYYEDQPFRCKDCGAEEVWTARQQKWWYEVAGGNFDSRAVRCKACRIKERARIAEARRTHLEGLARKQARLAHNA